MIKKTKYTVSMTLTLEHQPEVKLTYKAVATHVRNRLESSYPLSGTDFEVRKVTVRAMDTD